MSAAMLPRRIRTDGFIDPCISAIAAKSPAGLDWVHEIKHDRSPAHGRARYDHRWYSARCGALN
jgi:hypothetical protein